MSDQKKSRTATIFVICLVLIVSAWIVIPHFWRLMLLGDVDSAISTLRILVDEESHFAESHPDLGYTCAISDFGSSKMLRDLAKSGRRNGYAFELNCPEGNRTGPRLAFQVTARPLHSELSAYCSDQSGILRYDEQGSTAKCLQSGTPL